MNAAEFTAACPEPHIILGLRLLPLSLGRYKLLKRFNSPFVSDDEIALDMKGMTEELFFALVICGLPCSEFVELENNGQLHRQLKRWGRRVNKYIKREKYFSILEKAEAFKRYLTESYELPWRVYEKETNNEVSPVHWSNAIEVVLMSKLNWTNEMVNEEPFIRALMHYFKFMESEGQVNLVSPEAYIEMQKQADENGRVFEAILNK